MKHRLKTIVTLLMAFLLQSCQDKFETSDPATPSPEEIAFLDYSNGPVYPHADGAEGTRSAVTQRTFENNWETYSYVNVPFFGTVATPWSNNAKGDAWRDVARDIKYKDGWTMVMHSFYEPADNPGIFMFFYNQRTGDLKIFYYHTYQAQNCTTSVWWAYCNDACSWFNALGEVASPVQVKFGSEWKYGSTFAQDQSRIKEGWNIMVIPNLAYDPSSPEMQAFQISTSSSNVYAGTMTATIDGDIVGKITSDVSENPFASATKAISTLAGDKAKDWILKYLSKNNTSSSNTKTGTTLLAQGVKGLISLGVKKILNSFTSLFTTAPPDNLNLRLDLNATINGDFKLTQNGNSGAIDRSFEIGDMHTGMKLGVWNLADNPTIYIHPVGTLCSAPLGLQSDDNTYLFGSSGKYKADVLINPELQPYLKSYWTECEIMTYLPKSSSSRLPTNPLDYLYSHRNSTRDYGSLGARSNGSGCQPSLLDKAFYGNNEYEVYDNHMKTTMGFHRLWQTYGKYDGAVPVYKYVYGPVNNGTRRGEFKFNVLYNLAKVTVYLVTEFGGKRDTTVTMRTYTPKFEWDPDLVKNYQSVSISDLQREAYQDARLRLFDNGTYSNLERDSH